MNAAVEIYNREAEEAALGALLITGGQALDDAPALKADHFFIHSHRWIFDAILHLSRSGQAADVTTIADYLGRAGHLAEAGGTAYLTRLMTHCISSARLAEYAAIVVGDDTRRRALALLGETARDIHGSNGNLPDVLSGAAAALDALQPRRGQSAQLYDAAEEWLEAALDHARTGKITGETTGFPIIDHHTNGLQRGELTLLAGRPSMGKSALAFEIAKRQARAGLRIGIFSMEMTRAAVFGRMAISELNLDSLHLKPEDEGRITAAASALAELPIAINADPGLRVGEMAREAREMERILGGLDGVVVDHIGYIPHEGERGDSKAARIGNTTKALIRLAKQMQIACLCLSQLRRADYDEGKAPDLDDLRESGDLEQDARQVWIYHRPGYYAPLGEKPDQGRPQKSSLIVRKNHNGPRDVAIPLAFVEQSARVSEWELRYENL